MSVPWARLIRRSSTFPPRPRCPEQRARSGSRMKAACRRAASRPAASPSPSPWPINTASTAWPCRPMAMPGPRCQPMPAGWAWRAGVLRRKTRRKPICARWRCRAPMSSRSTAISIIAGRLSGSARRKWAGLMSRPSRSPTGSRARRRWAWNSPPSSAGGCPTPSSTRPAAAQASSACGRLLTRWSSSAGSARNARKCSPSRRKAARPSSRLMRTARDTPRNGSTQRPPPWASASPRRLVIS